MCERVGEGGGGEREKEQASERQRERQRAKETEKIFLSDSVKGHTLSHLSPEIFVCVDNEDPTQCE